MIQLGRHMYTLHGRGANLPFLFRFGHGPILVQLNFSIVRRNPTANTLALLT